MKTIDEYKKQLALTNERVDDAEQFFDELCDQGILIKKPEAKRAFCLNDYYKPAQTDFERFLEMRATTVRLDSVARISWILTSILDTTDLDESQSRELLGEMLQETRPRIQALYRVNGESDAVLIAEFNAALLWYVIDAYYKWSTPLRLLTPPALETPSMDNILTMPDDELIAEFDRAVSVARLFDRSSPRQREGTDIITSY